MTERKFLTECQRDSRAIIALSFIDMLINYNKIIIIIDHTRAHVRVSRGRRYRLAGTAAYRGRGKRLLRA